tara:strand:- start:12571 stop:14589 length:2019 start_codon:yes stop_codon:yes gene_type:complete
MVKKYLVWPIRLFLYFIALFILSFYAFCLFISTDYGSKSITKYLFEDNIQYEKISIEPSLLGIQVDIRSFQYKGAAAFSGEKINLEINFLNSIIGNKIYVSNLSLFNSEVTLNEQRDINQNDQPEVFISELSITDLKVGDTIFKEINLFSFLTNEDAFGFNFQNLNIDLPGNLRNMSGLNGVGYFYNDELKVNLNSKKGIMYFNFYDAPQILENMEGHIYLDFQEKFKIPYANITSLSDDSDLRLTFKYDDKFQLNMVSSGDEKTILKYLVKNQSSIKDFLKESDFKANKLDFLLSISSSNNKLNFSSVLNSESSVMNLGDAKFAVNNLKTYIDNSSFRLFGDDLYLSEYPLGNIYLSNNFMSNNLFNFLLDDRGISGKFDNNGKFQSIFGDFSSPENLNFKISLNNQNLLLNYNDIFIEFNYLDSYNSEGSDLKIFPKNFKSNFLSLNEKLENSFDVDLIKFSLKNINAQLSVKNKEENPLRNSNLSFSNLDLGLKNSFINIKDSNYVFGGLVEIYGKDISYTDTTFTIDALRVLSLIDIRSRLLNILNADFEKLDQDNFFINSLNGNFFIDSSGYANINQLKMDFDVGNAELSGTISSVEESFDNFNLEMIFDSSLSESIPWYVAILGGFPAAAGAVVVTEVLEEGLSDITRTKYSVSGEVDNLNIEVMQ